MLMIMPEGIVLVNKETKDVELANFEFLRLFNINKLASHNDVKDLISEQKVLQVHSQKQEQDITYNKGSVAGAVPETGGFTNNILGKNFSFINRDITGPN